MYEYVYEYDANTPAPLFICPASKPGNKQPHGIRQKRFALRGSVLVHVLVHENLYRANLKVLLLDKVSRFSINFRQILT